MAHGVGVTRTADSTTVLDFAFLVYPDGDAWIGRSVNTGHVAESRTAAGAVLNLTRAIDVAIEVAGQRGYSARQWYEAQQPDEPRFLQLFVASLCRTAPERRSLETQGGRVVLNTAIAQERAA